MNGPQSGRNPVIRRILKELDRQSRELSELEEFLELAGIDLPVMMVDEWATIAELRLIAVFLMIKASELIALKGDNEATAFAQLREQYAELKEKPSFSLEKAWDLLSSSTYFRGSDPSRIGRQVSNFLLAQTIGRHIQECNFLDCPFRCITKCRKTGRKPGA